MALLLFFVYLAFGMLPVSLGDSLHQGKHGLDDELNKKQNTQKSRFIVEKVKKDLHPFQKRKYNKTLRAQNLRTEPLLADPWNARQAEAELLLLEFRRDPLFSDPVKIHACLSVMDLTLKITHRVISSSSLL